MHLKSLPLNRKYLSAHTSIKIGGYVENFFTASSLDGLKEAYGRWGNDFYLLGAGSNILASDENISRPVVKLKGNFDYFHVDCFSVEAGGGTSFNLLLKECLKNNVGGFENLVGIPGTIGAMIAINAGAYKHTISDYLSAVEVFDRKSGIKRIEKSKIEFGYRSSSLQDKIILRAWFNLHEDRFAGARAKDLFKERSVAQDYTHPSFGSTFKNPSGMSAGRLIEECGLKGFKRNDAQISPRHANFIINLGKAACKDVEYLIEKVKAKVYKKYNILLEEEVIRWK